MSLLDNLPHRVTISRFSYASDDYGRIDSLREMATDVPAWIQNADSRDIVESEKHRQAATHRVAFSGRPPVNIRPGDWVTATAGPSYVGVQLKFLAWADRSAGLGVMWVGLFDENVPDDPPGDDS